MYSFKKESVLVAIWAKVFVKECTFLIYVQEEFEEQAVILMMVIS